MDEEEERKYQNIEIMGQEHTKLIRMGKRSYRYMFISAQTVTSMHLATFLRIIVLNTTTVMVTIFMMENTAIMKIQEMLIKMPS